MTREQFDLIDSWEELKDLCSDYGLHNLDDIESSESIDEYIYDNLQDYAFDYGWAALRDVLSEIETGYGYYYNCGLANIRALDDYDFRDYKDDVYQEMVDRAYFDDEDDDGEDDYIEDNHIEVTIEQSPIPLNELFQDTVKEAV